MEEERFIDGNPLDEGGSTSRVITAPTDVATIYRSTKVKERGSLPSIFKRLAVVPEALDHVLPSGLQDSGKRHLRWSLP